MAEQFLREENVKSQNVDVATDKGGPAEEEVGREVAKRHSWFWPWWGGTSNDVVRRNGGAFR